MNKQEYLQALAAELARLTPADRDAAMEFYEEYLEDAEDEQQAIAKLGPPRDVARSVMADRAVQDITTAEREPGVRKGVSALWIVALATLSPFALFLALVVIFVFLSVFAALVLSTVLTFGSGVLIIVSSFFTLGIDILSAVFFFGAGLVMLGVSLLVATAIWRLGSAMLRGMTLMLNKRRKRRNAA